MNELTDPSPARRAALHLLATAFAASSCSQRSDDPPIRATEIYPYLVTAAYPVPSSATYREIGNGLRVAIVSEHGGLVRSVTPAEIAELGMSWTDAEKRAAQNLERLAKDGKIGMQLFREGPAGPFILFGGHWGAAACLLLPRLHGLAAESLESDALGASVPHRDALLVFPRGDHARRDAMRAMIREKEGDGAKPLTFDLFELTDSGPRPLRE